MSTFLGRIGPLWAGTFGFRPRYLAIYDDALLYVRLNRWEDADIDTALLVADNPMVAGVTAVAGLLASAIGTRRNRSALRELRPQELASRHKDNWLTWARDITEIVVFRSYDVSNSRRLLVRTAEGAREIRYSYPCGPDEKVSDMLAQVAGTRYRLVDEKDRA